MKVPKVFGCSILSDVEHILPFGNPIPAPAYVELKHNTVNSARIYEDLDGIKTHLKELEKPSSLCK